MIEAGANEIPEDQMIEAIYKCHDINQTVIAFMDQIVMRLASQSMSMRAVLFRSRCLRISRKLLLQSRWRKQYSQMRSRSVRKYKSYHRAVRGSLR